MIDPAHRCPRRIFTIDRNNSLADILGEIAYALDLIGNPQDADNLPKVAGYRLTPRNDLDRSLLDVALHAIDRGVGADDALRATAIARRQSCDRLGNLPLGQPAHLCDCPREFRQVRVETFGGMCRKSHGDGIDPSCGASFYDDSMSAR